MMAKSVTIVTECLLFSCLFLNIPALDSIQHQSEHNSRLTNNFSAH